nr:hemerythrin domain-containing protein [Clostridium sp. 19966]
MVFHMNNLAGKLRIHLNSEDKFLYPNLVNGEDMKLKALANEYIEDMGGIFNQFSEYKNKFNTKSKIKDNNKTFLQETRLIIDKIKKRIDKEENELYKLI